MNTITLEKFKTYAIEELGDTFENEYISKDFLNILIRETYNFYYESIKTCLLQTKDDTKRIENAIEQNEWNEFSYEENQIGFYLELEDLKTHKIIGGNGYTGYNYQSYEYVLRDNLRQHLLSSYLKDIYKAYESSEYFNEFIDFNSELECTFEEMIEFFKDKSIDEIVLEDITIDNFNKINNDLATLKFDYEDLKNELEELKVNYDDLESFIELRNLQDDYYEYVTSL